MNLCKACDDKFQWHDQVVIVNDEPYHKDCLTLYPTGYIAFLDGEPLGETENDDGKDASELFPETLDDEEE